MFNPEFLPVASTAKRIRVFVSYDRDSDGDLYDLLAEQASKRSSRFEVSARSRARPPTDVGDEALRRAIREADQVIVICGEHTHGSERVGAELRVAQEEARPYHLLWGRRERMCTKPATARPADAMYSWTREILERQVLGVIRAARSSGHLANLSRAKTLRAVDRSAAQEPGAVQAEPGGAGEAGH